MDPGVYSGLRQCKGYCTEVWGREASRKWEEASVMLGEGWRRGRMLIKIINRGRGESQLPIARVLSDQVWESLELLQAPSGHCTPCPEEGILGFVARFFLGTRSKTTFKSLTPWH